MRSNRLTRMTRRIIGIGIGKCVLILGLLFRMYQLQVLEGPRYQELAEGNRLLKRTIPAPRGKLLDRHGIHLSLNAHMFQAILSAQNATEADLSLHSLRKIIDVPDAYIESAYKAFSSPRHKQHSLILKRNLDWREVAQIETNIDSLPGISIGVGQVRSYPYDHTTAHTLGYVSLPNKKRSPTVEGLYEGQIGLEKSLEQTLRGQDGERILEVNALRRLLREVSRIPPIPGKDCTLSLDIHLQKYVAQCLAPHKSASAVVLDVQTGEILSSVSQPAFDPNLFAHGISPQDWNALLKHPQTPLLDKTVAGLYAPGSVVKMAVALAGLNQGIIDSSTRVLCTGYTTVGSHRFHCWAHRWGGHGSMNLNQAIAQSCDIFFYELAKKINVQDMLSLFHTVGLGERFLEEIQGVNKGLIPSPTWKKTYRNSPWGLGDTILTAIGQGAMLSTPLQMAVMAARLATGRQVMPSYIRQNSKSAFPSLSLSPQYLAYIQKGMDDMMNDPKGMGYRQRIIQSGFEMAGKTGTSQVRRITIKEREQGLTQGQGRPWAEQEHAVFCGYAPRQNPRYSVAVVVEHGGSGGRVALPIARNILMKVQGIPQAVPHPSPPSASSPSPP